jgi:hypothetical protein
MRLEPDVAEASADNRSGGERVPKMGWRLHAVSALHLIAEASATRDFLQNFTTLAANPFFILFEVFNHLFAY